MTYLICFLVGLIIGVVLSKLRKARMRWLIDRDIDYLCLDDPGLDYGLDYKSSNPGRLGQPRSVRDDVEEPAQGGGRGALGRDA